MNRIEHGLVLLAAGSSRRLGLAKQLLVLDGETLVHRAARLGLATAPQDAVVVTGAVADAVSGALADLPIRVVPCAEWQRGMGRSLRDGLDALDLRCAGALVLLCDQPGLDEAHLRALLEAWQQAPDRAAASAYAGVLGVPALLPRAWFAELAELQGEQGARDLLRQRATDTAAIPAPGLARDIDLPGDLVSALGAVTRRE